MTRCEARLHKPKKTSGWQVMSAGVCRRRRRRCTRPTVYGDYVERFITKGLLNTNSMLKKCHRSKVLGVYSENSVWVPSSKRLDSVTLHHVHCRNEIWSLRTYPVFYYMNANNLICSQPALDDAFEDRVFAEKCETNRRPVYFYNVLETFSCDHNTDVNRVSMREWSEEVTMIHESAYTITNYLTTELLGGHIPQDTFYPPDNMSPIDIVIDRMLERAMKQRPGSIQEDLD
ncbi:hypothetical protein J6590_060134 [Homalodisca vitripennis]|nr:hypothetical protein J6590_060134 [Homalodisca vitripennis]